MMRRFSFLVLLVLLYSKAFYLIMFDENQIEKRIE